METNKRDEQIVLTGKLLMNYVGSIPNGFYTELGKIHGVSRQRIEQIIKKSIPSKKTEKGFIRTCKYCKVKFKTKRKESVFCSPAHRKKYRLEYYWKTVNCLECKKEFKIYRNKPQQFCSKLCFGKYIARNFGWGSEIKRNGGLTGGLANIDAATLKDIIGGNTFTVLELREKSGCSYGYIWVLLWAWKNRGMITANTTKPRIYTIL